MNWKYLSSILGSLWILYRWIRLETTAPDGAFNLKGRSLSASGSAQAEPFPKGVSAPSIPPGSQDVEIEGEWMTALVPAGGFILNPQGLEKVRGHIDMIKARLALSKNVDTIATTYLLDLEKIFKP